MTYIKNIETANNFVSLADTNFIKEQISTTIEYYKGTEVTYTPTEGSSKVVYECNLQTAWTPTSQGSYSNSRLQYSTDGGTTWTEFDGTRLFCGSWSSNSDNVWNNYNWTFTVDSWTGERKVRLAGRSYNSTVTTFTLGRSYDASNSEGVGSCPHVLIYSI